MRGVVFYGRSRIPLRFIRATERDADLGLGGEVTINFFINREVK